MCVCVLPAAPGMTLSGYRSVRKRLLIKVDFPSPDSPLDNRKVKLSQEVNERCINTLLIITNAQSGSS